MAAYAAKRLTLISPLAYAGIRRDGPLRLRADAFEDVVAQLTGAGIAANRHDLLATCAQDGLCFYGVAVTAELPPAAPFHRVTLEPGRYAFCQLGDAETADLAAARRALETHTRQAGAAPEELPVYARLVEEPGDRRIAQLLAPLPDAGG